LQYLSTREIEDAWAIDNDEVASIMQKVWDYTYGARVLYEIAVVGPVFFIVSTLAICNSPLTILHIQADQRACEWHSGFGSTALAILQEFFTDNQIDSDAACQKAVESALDNWTFLYREVTVSEKSER
jgi:predicted molibdopterin-dependent oxidoreductase YjgC